MRNNPNSGGKRKKQGQSVRDEIRSQFWMVPKRGAIDKTSAPRDARLAASKKAAEKKARDSSKPVPIGGVKKAPSGRPSRKSPNPPRAYRPAASPSVPAKGTGGLEKKSYGGWSVPKKVKPSKKTAAGVQRRSQQGRRVK